jgi:DNA-binding CsgD family transcriptional regulator
LAREAGDAEAESHSLRLLAKLDLQAGQLADAQSHLGAALQLAGRHRDFYRMRDCLLPGADLCAAAGLWAEAITLQAAERGCSEAAGLGTVPANQRRDELMRKAAQTLRPEQSQAAQQRGGAMTLDTAADFLLLLTETDLQTSPAPNAPPELSGLSAREQELVTLVAQGLTDAQIAGKLYISISTVRSHLDRIRDKTSCRRRADLTRLALQASLA